MRRIALKIAFLAIGLCLALQSAAPAFADDGWATWYGPGFHGNVMANGQIYNQYDPTTTASNLYPFGAWLKVTGLKRGKVIYVQVRDRGAFNHALDLSYAAFKELDEPAEMWTRVRYEVVPGPGQSAPAPAAAKPAPTATPKPVPTATPAQTRPEPSARSSRVEASDNGKHIVAPGETLWSIASKYDLSVESLQTINGLPEGSFLQIGQELALTAPVASRQPKAQAMASVRTHTVASGELLGGIAVDYGVSVEDLRAENGILDPNNLSIGQELIIPGGPAAAPAAAPAPAATGPQKHTIVQGETFYDIALQYDLSVDDLIRMNPLSDPSLIQPGDVLLIY